MVSLKWIDRIPLRIKLTAWYVLLLGLTLGGFTGYLYFRLERKLIAKLDTALQIAASQFLVDLADEGSSLRFQNTPIQRSISRRLRQVGFAVRLMTPDGKVVDGFGRYRELPAEVPTEEGHVTRSRDEVEWRTIDQPVIRHGQLVGWLQVAQSLEPLEEISEELPMEVLFSLPVVLLLAACGGLFLSNRALRPIKQINRTAQAIAATDDLNRRVNYWGAADEVGQLATTFDQMLDRLQAAFEREQQFTANAAHELRTPLAVIKGRIGVTRTRLRTVAEYDKTLQDLEQEVDRLIRLSNGLLLLARIDRGQFPFNLLSVDLSSLLEVIVEQIQPLAEKQQIAIANHLPSELLVQGDPDCLTNLFLNLLDNAVKYTPAGGMVRLWLKDRDSEEVVRVAVSNTGIGIPSEHLPHLFERFYRVESVNGSKNGAGLGLAIASEIVRLHGGAIAVESNPGQETTFTVNLPASDQR